MTTMSATWELTMSILRIDTIVSLLAGKEMMSSGMSMLVVICGLFPGLWNKLGSRFGYWTVGIFRRACERELILGRVALSRAVSKKTSCKK
jgi:hypothetical protein